jgi:hemerythrin-like domain-containing protein
MASVSNLLNINQPHIPDFTDPLRLLVHCHQRIEAQLTSLQRAGEVIRGADTATLATAFAAVDVACNHFAIAGVRHTLDEEISLFPRLRDLAGAAGREALAAMSDLEFQHRTAELLHSEFDDLVRYFPRDGSADTREVDYFNQIVSELAMLYRPHILLENNLVFPIAARVLPASEIQQIGKEMRARREDVLHQARVS